MIPRILVAYYSRSGSTKKLARSIAAAVGADLEEITDRTQRSGALGYLRSGFEAYFERLVDIGPSVFDPKPYDLVIVGTPIWSNSVSSPVRSYLQRHHDAMRAVAFFCTCAGRGGERAFTQMAQACGTQPAATLIVRESELARTTAVERFAADVRGALVGAASSVPPLPVVAPPIETSAAKT